MTTYSFFEGWRIDPDTLSALRQAANFGLRPANVAGETISRRSVSGTGVAPTTANTVFVAYNAHDGEVITNLDFWSTATAGATLTHQLAGVYSSGLALKATSTDHTNEAWAANTKKRFVMTTPYVVDGDQTLYLAIAIAATTVPTLAVAGGLAVLNLVSPAVAFTDSTHTISTALAATASADAGFNVVYVAVS